MGLTPDAFTVLRGLISSIPTWWLHLYPCDGGPDPQSPHLGFQMQVSSPILGPLWKDCAVQLCTGNSLTGLVQIRGKPTGRCRQELWVEKNHAIFHCTRGIREGMPVLGISPTLSSHCRIVQGEKLQIPIHVQCQVTLGLDLCASRSLC